MASPGLRWLADEDRAFCLLFVRGVPEDQIFSAYGADPATAEVCEPGESPSAPAGTTADDPVVSAARAGEWIVAVDSGETPQGIRAEVLRAASAGREAVALYQDIGKLNHEFVYAADGHIVTGLTTSVPLNWYGSDPGRLEPLARELGLDDDADLPDEMTEMQAVLSLAERAFGLSLTPADLSQPMRCARIVAPLEDPVRPPAAARRFGAVDPPAPHSTARPPDLSRAGLRRYSSAPPERHTRPRGTHPRQSRTGQAGKAQEPPREHGLGTRTGREKGTYRVHPGRSLSRGAEIPVQATPRRRAWPPAMGPGAYGRR